MRYGRIVLVALLLCTAVVVQSTVLTRIPFPQATPDLVLLVVVALAMVLGPNRGALIGFVGRLMLDTVPPGDGAVGRWALVLVLVGWFAGTYVHAIEGSALLPLLVIVGSAFARPRWLRRRSARSSATAGRRVGRLRRRPSSSLIADQPADRDVADQVAKAEHDDHPQGQQAEALNAAIEVAVGEPADQDQHEEPPNGPVARRDRVEHDQPTKPISAPRPGPPWRGYDDGQHEVRSPPAGTGPRSARCSEPPPRCTAAEPRGHRLGLVDVLALSDELAEPGWARGGRCDHGEGQEARHGRDAAADLGMHWVDTMLRPRCRVP